MLDIIMLLLIGSWFYKTAYHRKQNKALWVIGGLSGYLAGEYVLGWTIAKFLITTNPNLWFLQTLIFISSGLIGMLIVRLLLLTFYGESQKIIA